MKWHLCAAALLAATGCDRVFNFSDPRAVDAAPISHDAPISRDAPTNCSPDEHDEDGDHTPDRCDLCPEIADNGVDTDGDGIGDACDPSLEPHDQRIAFFGFDGAPQGLALLSENGNGGWTPGSDQLVMDSTAADGDYIARLDVHMDEIVVATRVTISFSGAPSGSRSAGLWAQVDPSSEHIGFPTGVVAELIDYTNKQYLHVVQVPTFPANEMASASSPELFANNATYLLTLMCRPIGGCTVVLRDPGQTIARETAEILPDPFRSGSIGLRVHGDVRAVFDYLVVYKPSPATL